MNYDRRLIEAVKKQQQRYSINTLPFVKTFIVLTVAVFVLTVLLH